MKIFLLCYCFVAVLCKANDSLAAAGVTGTVMSLIPPQVALPVRTQYEMPDFVKRTTANILLLEDDASKLRRYYLECIDETHVKPNLVMKFKAGSWAEHPILKRWALCVLVRVGLMSYQGVLRYDTAMSKIPLEDRDQVDRLLSRCLSQSPKRPQDIAWSYLECHHKRDRKNKFPSLGIFYTI